MKLRTLLFAAYADTPWRRTALHAPETLPDKYLFYGLSGLEAQGFEIRHNLEKAVAGKWWVKCAFELNRIWEACGGVGGDWLTPIRYFRCLNSVDLIWSTVDRVGVPLALLKGAGLLRPPLVYVSVGLPEKLARLGNVPMRWLYRRALMKAELIVCYGRQEVIELRRWLGPGGGNVRFLPFAVDIHNFQPQPATMPAVDILSVGADSHRDFPLLVTFAHRHPEISISVITRESHAVQFQGAPPNIRVHYNLPLARVREHLAAARSVVLPVKDNSYSGATTTLLQAMAMGKPVVVSATGAILRGYRLRHDQNCLLVTPGSISEFEEATLKLLRDPLRAHALGKAARELVLTHNNWDLFVQRLSRQFRKAVAANGWSHCAAAAERARF